MPDEIQKILQEAQEAMRELEQAKKKVPAPLTHYYSQYNWRRGMTG
jgi:hypothetical protein